MKAELMIPSKKKPHRHDQARPKSRSPQPAARNLNVAQPQRHLTSLIQRAQLDPRSLTPGEALQLQRLIGNQALGQLMDADSGGVKAEPEIDAGTSNGQYQSQGASRAGEEPSSPPRIAKRTQTRPDWQRRRREKGAEGRRRTT